MAEIESVQKALGQSLRNRRLATGLSQDRFADSIGMHRAYYSSIERGEKNVTLETLARVAAGSNSRIWELFREVGL